MPDIHFRTNLTLDHQEKFPKYLSDIPRVGDLIESAKGWDGRVLQLEVVSVTWKPSHDYLNDRNNDIVWRAEVELHLPRNRWESIRHFYEWYGTITGRGAGAFI